MEALKNSRHELFAQGVAGGLSGTRAYKDAGYKARGHAAEAKASDLVRNGEVAARINHLKSMNSERSQMTRDEFIRDLVAIWRGEKEEFRSGDRLKAGEMIAKLCGWLDQSNDSDIEVNLRIGGNTATDSEVAHLLKIAQEHAPAAAIEQYQQRFNRTPHDA